jgi:serine/threonine protein kinase
VVAPKCAPSSPVATTRSYPSPYLPVWPAAPNGWQHIRTSRTSAPETHGPVCFRTLLARRNCTCTAVPQVVHRDLKPANVLLSGYTPGVGSGGVAKLCDFGFARPVRTPIRGGRGRSATREGVAAAAVEEAVARYGTKLCGDTSRMSSYVMTRWYRPPGGDGCGCCCSGTRGRN